MRFLHTENAHTSAWFASVGHWATGEGRALFSCSVGLFDWIMRLGVSGGVAASACVFWRKQDNDPHRQAYRRGAYRALRQAAQCNARMLWAFFRRSIFTQADNGYISLMHKLNQEDWTEHCAGCYTRLQPWFLLFHKYWIYTYLCMYLFALPLATGDPQNAFVCSNCDFRLCCCPIGCKPNSCPNLWISCCLNLWNWTKICIKCEYPALICQ